jgi:CRP/FNR family transcriptional regulator
MNRLRFDQLPIDLQALTSFQQLDTGQVLFAQHEVVQAAFILESGKIQLVSYTEDGQQIHHYTVWAGESFAEVALFHERYLCTAIASTPSRVLALPKQAYLAALKAHPLLAEMFMAQLAHRLYDSKILLELRSIRPAHKRVLHYLRLNVQADGVTVKLDRPLKEIADDLGLTPEALSRTLNQLHAQRMINRRKRIVTLCKE